MKASELIERMQMLYSKYGDGTVWEIPDVDSHSFEVDKVWYDTDEYDYILEVKKSE